MLDTCDTLSLGDDPIYADVLEMGRSTPNQRWLDPQIQTLSASGEGLHDGASDIEWRGNKKGEGSVGKQASHMNECWRMCI